MRTPVIAGIIAIVAVAIAVPLAGPLFDQGAMVDEGLPAGALVDDVDFVEDDKNGDTMMDDGMDAMMDDMEGEQMMNDGMMDDKDVMMDDGMDGLSDDARETIMDLTEKMKDGSMSDESKKMIEDMIEEIKKNDVVTKNEKMEDEMPEHMLEEMMEEKGITVYEGTFMGLGDRVHEAGGGVVTVPTEDGKTFLRLKPDFWTNNGPHLVVYLADKELTQGRPDPSSYHRLGDLRGTSGAQNYEIPEGVDLEKFKHVMIWCEPFSIQFGHAELKQLETK